MKYIFLFVIYFLIIISISIYIYLNITNLNITNSKINVNRNIDKNVIFCFWTGENEMSENRNLALQELKKNSKCNVVLITPKNLKYFILKNEPLHEAYTYLHYTHKADYLRTYFMHFYGGGYSDIKNTTSSWIPAFDDMKKNPEAFINGYAEKSSGDIANDEVSHLYEKLVGNCSYIVNPNTKFTNEWYSEMKSLLDKKLPTLKKDLLTELNDPSNVPCKTGQIYSVEWNEMLGRIFHKVLAKYVDTGNILYTVPYPVVNDYR